MNSRLLSIRSANMLAMTLVMTLLSSCAITPKVAKAPPAPPLFEWKDDPGSLGHPSVRIALDEQKAYVYRGSTQIGWTTLASGLVNHPSPTGHFYIMEKIVDKHSNTYGVIVDSSGSVVNWDAKAGETHVPSGCHFAGAPMPYWMRLTGGGVGMHAGDIPFPGRPASHGCIRLPAALAPKLFEVVEVGTPVTVSGTAPY